MHHPWHKKTAILNQFCESRSELVGACRFFRNDAVLQEALIAEQTLRCAASVGGKHVLAIQDSSEINYRKHKGKLDLSDPELGPVGNNKDIGFFIHPTMVVDAETGFPLGFSHIHLWNRSWDKGTKHERNYAALPIEEKESFRWIESSQRSKGALETADSVTIITDREGDIYEEFVRVPDERTHLLIRSRQNRRLFGTDELLYEYLSDTPLQTAYILPVKGISGKRRSREARIEVRFTEVRIARPALLKDGPEFVTVFAVEAKESIHTVPENEEPIRWRILTTHTIFNPDDALRIIRWYTWRWSIEQLFRILKTQGLNVETSQMEKGIALKKMVIMGLDASLKVMQLVEERDGKAGKPASVVFTSEEVQCLKELKPGYEGHTAKQKNFFEEGSLAWAAWIIARLGGWKGYRKASPPGPITMKRGLDRFFNIFEGWSLSV